MRLKFNLTSDKTEYLFLPCEESEVFKTAYRLDADVKSITTSVHEHNIPENIYEIFTKDGKAIGNFNKFAKILHEVGDQRDVGSKFTIK